MELENDFFYDIYEKYKYLMFSIAMDVLNDKFAAEDAVQEAFLKILKNSNKVDDIDSIRTKRLVITIAKNSAIDIYRKQRKIWNTEIEMDMVSIVRQSNIYTIEDDEKFLEIEGLPDMYKEVLILKYSSEFSNTEIAELLEISEMNVRKRISRARKLLKQKLDERRQANESIH